MLLCAGTPTRADTYEGCTTLSLGKECYYINHFIFNNLYQVSTTINNIQDIYSAWEDFVLRKVCGGVGWGGVEGGGGKTLDYSSLALKRPTYQIFASCYA